MTIKLGISPINWCNDDDPNLGKNISFEQCIQEMSIVGFQGTEIGNKFPRDPVLLKSYLANHQLEIASAWFSTYFTETDRYQETLSRFLEHLSFLRALGARYINVCECGYSIHGKDQPIIGNNKPVFSENDWKNLIRGLHQIGRIAHDFHMHIVYHYHAGTGVFTETEIDFLLTHTSPTLISLLLDTGHAALAGTDPIQLVLKHGARIQYVHLKDIRKPVLELTQENQWNFMDAIRAGIFTVPGDGDINFTDVIEALLKMEYQGWMLIEAEQDPEKAPPLFYANKAFHYVSTLLNKGMATVPPVLSE